jgi:ATP-binding protein involved in chromosome partitioning
MPQNPATFAIAEDDVLAALTTVLEPDLQQDVVSAGLITDVELAGSHVTVRGRLTTPGTPHKTALESAMDVAVRSLPGIETATIELTAGPITSTGKLTGIRHVIGVGAGKGGVGKSTVAVNLAMALSKAGARVGLLDADIYGPSVPIMLGLRGAKPAVNAQRKIVPAVAHGLKTVSMGFMVQEDMAVAWRGPMVGKAVTQFVEDVAWGELDYLIVDLPPGTGDIILSLCQSIPLSGAVVVSTPQDVAFADVLRAVRMFSMLKVEVLGLVENMSWFRCPDNGKDYEIFGPSNSPAHCAAHEVNFLGRLPIDMMVSPNADAGLPITVAEPNSELARLYRDLAGKIASRLVQIGAKQQQRATVGEGFFSGPPAA